MDEPGMTRHDSLCPYIDPLARDPVSCTCSLIAKVRVEEQKLIAGVCKMLLDSGDITPMGVRMLTKTSDDE